MTPQLDELALIHAYLDYSPETGALTWRERGVGMFPRGQRDALTWNAKFAGKPALTTQHGTGYLHGRIASRNFYAHRVAWALANGSWPQGEVDHINGVRSDNRAVNLRAVSRSENQRNRVNRRTATLQVVGVHWSEPNQKWHVKIRANGRNLHLGSFASFHDAVVARLDAEERFDFHPNHGRAA